MEAQELPVPQAKPIEQQPRTNFQRVLELGARFVVKNPKVEGLDNLANLAPDKRVIFASSHLSDTDPTIAAVVLSKYRKLDIASLETNQRDPFQGTAMKIMGREKFHDISGTFDIETKMPHTSFNPQNFEQMEGVLRQGADLLIAAHKPSRNWQLPDSAGVGDVYLAHLTESPIIPVAVDIHSEKAVGMASDLKGTFRRALSGKRPEVTVRIGTPISFEKIDPAELADVGMFLSGRRAELKKDGPRYQKALENYNKLREQGGEVIQAIANLLPAQKRGRWVTSSTP